MKQIYMKFNVLSDKFGLYVFIHNKDQMFFPKVDKIFGSEFLALMVDGARMKKAREQGTAFHISTHYKLSKSHWKALDTPTKRCKIENVEANTTKCIVQFMETKIGCSMGLAKSNSNFKRYKFVGNVVYEYEFK